MSPTTLRTRFADRRRRFREYREFERAVRDAQAHGGAGDLLAAYRRL